MSPQDIDDRILREAPLHQRTAAPGVSVPANNRHVGGTNNPPGPAPSTAGPHHQDLLNKLDPTVDSMHGGTQVLGSGINSTSMRTGAPRNDTSDYVSAHSSHVGTEPQSGIYHNQHTSHVSPNTVTTARGAPHLQQHHAPGPERLHHSQLANNLDPRVANSTSATQPMQMSGATTTYAHPSAPSAYGHSYGSNEGPGPDPASGHAIDIYGHQSTNMINDAEPGMNYSHDGRRHDTARVPETTVHHGPPIYPGPASKTAGPHRSNLMNKLDPAVDSKFVSTEQREYRIA